MAVALVLLLAQASPALAQMGLPGAPAEETAPTAELTSDPLGRSTPRGMVEGYLSAVADKDFDRASAYLDASALPANARTWTGPRLAEALANILDRSGWVVPSLQLVQAPEGLTNDGLAPDLERVGGIRIDGETVDIIIQRALPEQGSDAARDNAEAPIWRFSAETVAGVPAILARTRPSWVDRTLTSGWLDRSFWGVPAGHWLALLALIGLSLGVSRLLMMGVAALARVSSDRFRRGGGAALLEACVLPAGLILATILFQVGAIVIGTSVVARGIASRGAEIVGWVALAWLLWRVVDAVSRLGTTHMAAQNRNGAISVVGLVRRAAKIALAAIATIAALDALNVDVTTGLAALGIGGLALALGAQKTIENLVGSVTLVVDQPIRVGDVCKFGETLGTVEDIGMRSTQVRTLQRTVVTIPNGEFSSIQIENYSRRERFLFEPTLGLRYETSPAQIRRVLAQLRALLDDHPKVDPDPARVRFTTFGSDNLAIEIFAYVHAVDWNAYLAIQEDLNLAVMEIFETEGVEFAFPSQTIYLARDRRPEASERIAMVDREAA